MEPEDHSPGLGRLVKGKAGLFAVAAVIAILVAAFPAFRWFFLISSGIGLIVAGILVLWHKLRPVKAEEVENKHPLGLE